MTTRDPLALLQPRRKIHGMSAVLLPYTPAGEIDWRAYRQHLERTLAAGLTPAVNMDTGYVNLLSLDEQRRVLEIAAEICGAGRFVGGAFTADQPGAALDPQAHFRAVERVCQLGGLPIIFQSHGMQPAGASELLALYAGIGQRFGDFLAFELSQQFASFGQIYDLQVFAGLLEISQCVGLKHSSLSRHLEWERLALKQQRRPAFRLLTGNDLAIDMVMYGADYLLGLSSFAPDLFARRDALWEQGDPNFYELNDLLQYLGQVAFRPPVPAYKHSAAQFIRLRGWLASDTPHPAGLRRPESDLPLLADILRRLEPWLAG